MFERLPNLPISSNSLHGVQTFHHLTFHHATVNHGHLITGHLITGHLITLKFNHRDTLSRSQVSHLNMFLMFLHYDFFLRHLRA